MFWQHDFLRILLDTLWEKTLTCEAMMNGLASLSLSDVKVKSAKDPL